MSVMGAWRTSGAEDPKVRFPPIADIETRLPRLSRSRASVRSFESCPQSWPGQTSDQKPSMRVAQLSP